MSPIFNRITFMRILLNPHLIIRRANVLLLNLLDHQNGTVALMFIFFALFGGRVELLIAALGFLLSSQV